MKLLSKALFDPRYWIILLAIVTIAFDLLCVLIGNRLDMPALAASATMLTYASACWVWNDARKSKTHFPCDQIMIWPLIALPAYFYASRGWKGVFILLGLTFTYFAFGAILTFLVETIHNSQLRDYPISLEM